ncbi:hypothetical protein A3D72_02095 [Candidatus Uhrbacteria bacterium RIFCSPHIGHO2_02_FULL_57_19]|uniref:DNA 3'-5' helicase n=1 Tax=Candidatus Uhrbacteria bacterium RIFCSPHIGHO2_02_FULL_57_19 TaxID=1802391 RepID=A0A1F7U7H7_9BACT|nr:MAG: hypothetical protein A3D72_02095 [Candidatus Uhrbacteria bacterium RIFCSPHIGHO2_02_FULL_57_19]
MSSIEHLLTDLNPDQLRAVTHGSGPLLIVAGAGTGKTAVITRRIAWLIASGLAKPEEILALTFTEKAAGEMEERIDRLLPYGYVDLWISTFHAFGERLLRTHGLEIGLPNDFKMLSETEQWLLLRRHFSRLNLQHYRPLGNPVRFLSALVSHFSRAEDEMVAPEKYLEYVKSLRLNSDSPDLPAGQAGIPVEEIGRLDEVANAFHVYKTILREEDRLDFSDLINETLRLFQSRPALLANYRQQFKYILVDEFQDTNAAQYELVKILAGGRRNLAVVGDDDQSIYKFRGAAISNIMDFRREYADAAQIVLKKNYRSRQNLLGFAYRFIQHNNPNRLESTLGLKKNLDAAREGEGVVEHLHGASLADEARLVVEKILELRDSDSESSWNDFAILVRANDHAEPFLRAFALAGIPHDFVANRGLYTKPIVLDILNYLRLLDDYHESPAVYRTLNTPLINIPASELAIMTHYAGRKAVSLFETLRLCPAIPGISQETAGQIKNLLSKIEKHSEMARREPVGKVVLAFLHETGYLKARLSGDEESARKDALILNRFWKTIESFAADEEQPTVGRFLERVRLELAAGDSGDLPTDPDAGPEMVKVMTVHAAKGLEFKNVFLVNLVDRRFPTSERKETIPLPDVFVREAPTKGDAHLEEERRLFYVGCTRARDRLYLTSAEDYGGARKKKPSRFLIESGLATSSPSSTDISGGQASVHDGGLASAEYRLPDKLSFTQLKAFESCPLQYKFAHLLRIPVRGKQVFSFGKSIHGALQAFFNLARERQAQSQQTLFAETDGPVELPTWDDLDRLYRERWIDDWYESADQRQERFEKGRLALKNYWQEISSDFPRVTAVEQPFVVKIGEVSLKGVIDRVDRLPDGTTEIIDYKTGGAKTEETVDWTQLLIYQIAALEVLGLKPSKLTYEYVEEGKSLSTIGSPEQLLRVKETVAATAENIKNSRFDPTPDKRLCSSCDFRDICEFRAV